ncbi:hypothetical protein CRM22_002735 [Opisthorchis felineus]|uniref:Probable glycerol kinase n=1 Tax=Opisthorchis felineus TaxID=147828 RepID=A0A4S2M4P0_OPIFE|nr:hypothetical protein CRM22_002735 [Opisthorchis felineus]TGZ71284.1 hypothetical protein CRM22_002735 [Opisthorchis felineus]TGZ71285.1 hypothetical protein CRM22_002735 [Opisthorchis felineus]TGZ71286.1 hypothetical protein CRM22_002735 [Opisthorchis felineus]
MERLIVSIDQGTSSSRVLVFSTVTGEVVASHQVPVTPTYPSSGWIELDANQLYDTTLSCLNECTKQLNDKKRSVDDVAGIGLTNQRETTIVWDRSTGKPLAPAIVWSDARTADLVKRFVDRTPGKSANAFQRKTGLPIHSYFSALKLCWLLENNTAVTVAARAGRLLAGTVDTWVIWRLTNGQSHVTDVTNASRTLLFNLQTLDWDPELCKFFGIDSAILPRIASSAEVVGIVSDPECALKGVKICGILGDQQASLVAQTWATSPTVSFGPTVKVTYGTGAFMLWDIGKAPFFSDSGILTTVAFKMGAQNQVHYALEGSVAFAGATINWLKSKMKMFTDYKELESLAQRAYEKTEENGSDPCYLVPAFSGLFCPWWQENARAVLAGLTADVENSDMILAAIRSSVYQTYDVLRVATLASGGTRSGATLTKPREIVVDGGLANSSVLMQSLADILDMIVRRHNHSEMMTALGAAVAAALAVQIDPAGLLKLRLHPLSESGIKHSFSSKLSPHARQVMLTGWHAAVGRSLSWVEASTPDEGTDSLLELLSKMSKSPTIREPKPLAAVASNSQKKEEFYLTPGKFFVFLAVSLGAGVLLGRHLQ